MKKKASHPATMFILQKSNEVLSMIRAPFKRKPNNTNAFDASLPQNPSTSQSNRTSLVNLNDDCDVSMCDNSDVSNIYTEIDVCNEFPTNDLITNTSATNSNEFLSANILKRLFNESSDSIFNNENQSIKPNYVNESVAIQAQIHNEPNIYEIGCSDNNRNQNEQAAANDILKETANLSPKFNLFLSNISKSLKYRFKLIANDEIDLDESLPGVMASIANDFDTCANSQSKNVDECTSLKSRLKSKLITGFKLFKDSKVCYQQHTYSKTKNA